MDTLETFYIYFLFYCENMKIYKVFTKLIKKLKICVQSFHKLRKRPRLSHKLNGKIYFEILQASY